MLKIIILQFFTEIFALTSLTKLMNVSIVEKNLFCSSQWNFSCHFKFSSSDTHVQNPSLRHAKEHLTIKRQPMLKAFTEELYTRKLYQKKSLTRISNSCPCCKREKIFLLKQTQLETSSICALQHFHWGMQNDTCQSQRSGWRKIRHM